MSSRTSDPSSVCNHPFIGVGVMLWKQGTILLGQRLSAEGQTCWQFPGGHIESGENVIECAKREVLEETGLRVSRCEPAGYTNQSFMMKGREYFTLYVSAVWSGGEVRVMEPDKCLTWQWFEPSKLPSPLFAPITNYLQQYPDLSIFQIDE